VQEVPHLKTKEMRRTISSMPKVNKSKESPLNSARPNPDIGRSRNRDGLKKEQRSMLRRRRD
jgi:hypothetical protein